MKENQIQMSTTFLRASLTAVAMLGALLALAGPARAEFGFASFSAPLHDNSGAEVTQAGGHPHSTVAFTLNTRSLGDGTKTPDESLKSVQVRMPPGFVGNSEATPKCAHRDFRTTNCSRLTMVGVSTIGYSPFPVPEAEQPLEHIAAVYNLTPPDGAAAQLGFQVANTSVIVTVKVGPDGGYRLAADLSDLSENLQLYYSTLTLWGVPADMNGPGPLNFSFEGTYGGPGGGPRIPFITSPPSCTGPLTTNIRAESWHNPGRWVEASYTSPSGQTGCDQLTFDPSIDVLPATTQADAPSGYTVEVKVPQNTGPDGLATPALRRAVVTMPEGVSVSPSSATGLAGCTDAQFARGSSAPAGCPAASRIGRVDIDTPVLGEPLAGGIYVGQPLDGDPQGRMFRIFVEARGQGVTIKVEGQVKADPATGRLVTVFDDNPEMPFNTFRLTFDGGPRASLANPPTCGQKTATSEMTSWSGGAASTPSSAFAIDCAGIGGFTPLFSAGTVNPVGGSFSPLALRIGRNDRDQVLRGLTVEFPKGLLARLADVPLCADAQAAAGACPIESRIGSATIGAGPGSAPFTTPRENGSVYLTEGYKGAPYGLAVVVRAIAGPYDLGTVVVRQAVFVDRNDAHLTVVSDPLPTILKGAPLRLRSIDVDVDRPGFTLNPTSCRPMAVRATMASDQGARHQVAQRFQVGDCSALPFRPRLRMTLTNRSQMRAGRHPGLRAVLTQGARQANLDRVAVKLPLSLALDADNARGLCEFADGQKAEPTCPASSIVGRAVARTPILKRPLTGPVYFVKNVRIDRRTGRQIRTLPALVIPLRGEVALNLRATSSVSKGKLVTTFAGIPDAPVSRFELRINSGRNGILASNANICRRPRRQIADADIDGQNRKRSDRAVRLGTPCKVKRSRRGA